MSIKYTPGVWRGKGALAVTWGLIFTALAAELADLAGNVASGVKSLASQPHRSNSNNQQPRHHQGGHPDVLVIGEPIHIPKKIILRGQEITDPWMIKGMMTGYT